MHLMKDKEIASNQDLQNQENIRKPLLIHTNKTPDESSGLDKEMSKLSRCHNTGELIIFASYCFFKIESKIESNCSILLVVMYLQFFTQLLFFPVSSAQKKNRRVSSQHRTSRHSRKKSFLLLFLHTLLPVLLQLPLKRDDNGMITVLCDECLVSPFYEYSKYCNEKQISSLFSHS
jgi:hypothetical protein